MEIYELYKMEENENKRMIDTIDMINKKRFDEYKKKANLIDLHMHTNHSDGELSVFDLIQHCIDNNIKVMAITDHDTIEGVKQLPNYENLISQSGIKVIKGIELSAKYPHGRMHILGYNIDPNNKDINNIMYELKSNSLNSVLSIIEQIKRDYGIRFDYDDIRDLVNSNHNIGRPDIARLLIKYGYVNSVSEAFNKYLIDAYNKIHDYKKGLSYQECIELIKKSGGIPVLAHPNSIEISQKELLLLIKDMIKYGLMGIEAYHSNCSLEESSFYSQLAKDLNLYVTAGSDYHGKFCKPDVEVGTGKGNILINDLPVLKLFK